MMQLERDLRRVGAGEAQDRRSRPAAANDVKNARRNNAYYLACA